MMLVSHDNLDSPPPTKQRGGKKNKKNKKSKNIENLITSPDKTVASTPPNSPLEGLETGGGLHDTNDLIRLDDTNDKDDDGGRDFNSNNNNDRHPNRGNINVGQHEQQQQQQQP
eukprot:CAMPEP_0196140024 /NCGR_PEP_ID=MMETSP0910-20130528/7090_1 /TAXON_ID=49265 /ORGANISM="Thalassiosira rotula, Strain GSO102" /LENGTH=113 /DNA_ID=CAMNT_0041400831 /DNA_START=234 /DNA_END=571 /DNA_ORIENTATION=+